MSGLNGVLVVPRVPLLDATIHLDAHLIVNVAVGCLVAGLIAYLVHLAWKR